jgi:hypothetical protein
MLCFLLIWYNGTVLSYLVSLSLLKALSCRQLFKFMFTKGKPDHSNIFSTPSLSVLYASHVEFKGDKEIIFAVLFEATNLFCSIF